MPPVSTTDAHTNAHMQYSLIHCTPFDCGGGDHDLHVCIFLCVGRSGTHQRGERRWDVVANPRAKSGEITFGAYGTRLLHCCVCCQAPNSLEPSPPPNHTDVPSSLNYVYLRACDINVSLLCYSERVPTIFGMSVRLAVVLCLNMFIFCLCASLCSLSLSLVLQLLELLVTHVRISTACVEWSTCTRLMIIRGRVHALRAFCCYCCSV